MSLLRSSPGCSIWRKMPGERLVPCFGESGTWGSILGLFCAREQHADREIFGRRVSQKKRDSWGAASGPTSLWRGHGDGHGHGPGPPALVTPSSWPAAPEFKNKSLPSSGRPRAFGRNHPNPHKSLGDPFMISETYIRVFVSDG